jgi:hypothetical protein
LVARIRAAYQGMLIVNGGFNHETARVVLENDEADAFAEYAKSVPPTLIEYGGPGNKVEMNDDV